MSGGPRGEEITADEQLEAWVRGTSIHRYCGPVTLGDGRIQELSECTPDFSCCKPELLAAPEIRQAFQQAHVLGDQRTITKFLGVFLRACIELAGRAHGVNVHVTSGETPE